MSEEKAFSQARNCCFTLNNYTDEEYFAIKAWSFDYLVIGKEVGENNTPHLQGYVEWTSPKKWSTLKRLNGRIHWEKRRGTAKQAADYCKKDGDFFEQGEISGQGERSDLKEVTNYITDNRPTIDEVMMAYPVVFLKYAKSLTMMVDRVRTQPRTEKPKVVWLWGKSRVGKSWAATQLDPDYYMKDHTKWWNNYCGQKVVIFDDFQPPVPNTVEFRSFLNWTDAYRCQVETKGGYVNLNSPIMIITSEFSPEDKYVDNTLDQVMLRLVACIEVKRDTEVNLKEVLQLL